MRLDGINGFKYIYRWSAYYSISRRKPNKALKLKLQVWKHRVGVAWRNSMRCMVFFGDGIVGENYDQTPILRNEGNGRYVWDTKGT
eukprot:12414737-Karenia_brevis.AAC.1